MSTAGSGVIVAMSAESVGGIGGLGLLAIAGAGLLVLGGTVSVGGKAAVFCGRKVKEAIQRHVAEQRELARQAADYEERLRLGAHAAPAADTTYVEVLARLKRYQTESERPAPTPVLPAENDSGLEEPVIPPLALYDHADLNRASENLERELEPVGRALDSLGGAQWVGLVAVDDLRRQYGQLSAAVEHNRVATAGEAVTLQQSLRHELRGLRAEIVYRTNDGLAKYKERQQVARQLSETAAQLEVKTQTLSPDSELTSALQVAYELLARAETLFKEGDLVGAAQTGQNARDYIEQVSKSTGSLRAANLQVAIGAFQKYLQGFSFLPADPALKNLQDVINQAEAWLKVDRIEAAWQCLTAAQAEADALALEVEHKVQAAQQDGATRLIQTTLADIGYHSSAPVVNSDQSVEFKATRPDGAYFRIWVTAEGFLQYKAEKFGTAECSAETKRLFARLKEQGMDVNTLSEFNLTAIAERVRELMLRQGFANLREERQPDGRLILIGTKADGSQGETVINFDSNSHASPEQTQPAAAGSATQEQIFRLQLEAERRYEFHRQLAEQMRQRV